jgi:hypothetical protein
MNIRWTDIVTECRNYKAGFVATFRKYEGMTTDEKDGQGRPMKVSGNTFADHMGIPRETFKRWVRAEAVGPTWSNPDATQARTAASHSNVAKNMARSNPSSLVDAIQSAGPGAEDQVFHEMKLRRAGVDTSKANRKAADAHAHQQIEPIRRALATADVALCVAALKDATEHLKTAQSAGALNEESMVGITEAHEEFQFALTEARFSVS